MWQQDRVCLYRVSLASSLSEAEYTHNRPLILELCTQEHLHGFASDESRDRGRGDHGSQYPSPGTN